MRPLSKEEMRAIQLEILDVVMKFCDEHDILCFLDGGTLLGAVRHKGYIPWDDDIDVGMLRPDYDKFTKLFNEENTHYKFVSLETDPNYPVAFGRVCGGRKVSMSIDVFVMDNAPDDDKALRKMFLMQKVFIKLHSLRFNSVFHEAKGNILRKLCVYVARAIMHCIPSSLMPKNYFAHKMLKNAKHYSSVSTRRAGSFLGFHALAMDKDKFTNFIYAEFEGRKFKIPSGYDEWLTKLYGDYMTAPPESERVSPHGLTVYVDD